MFNLFRKYFEVTDDDRPFQPYLRFSEPEVDGFRCYFWKGDIIVGILFLNKHSNNYEFAASPPEYPSFTSEELNVISAKLKELNADVSKC